MSEKDSSFLGIQFRWYECCIDIATHIAMMVTVAGLALGKELAGAGAPASHGERSRSQLLFKLGGTGTRLILGWLFKLAVNKCLIDSL